MKSLILTSTCDDDAVAEVNIRLARSNPFLEPFAGHAPMLLRLDGLPGAKILNDIDGRISNFYRAVKLTPRAVARHAAWPLNQIDLDARHRWLSRQGRRLAARLRRDPACRDAKLAGWWAWGFLTCGDAWISGRAGILPKLAAGPTPADLKLAVGELSERLDSVSVTCGDWQRVLAPRLLGRKTGVFLDPPYAKARLVDGSPCRATAVSQACRHWAIAHGAKIKIALCSYEAEPAMPADWDLYRCEPKADGGGAQKPSGAKRCIWFSPRAAHPQLTLSFDIDPAPAAEPTAPDTAPEQGALAGSASCLHDQAN